MIIFFTLIRAVFIHKLPKKAFVLMWEIVILRLLLPVKIPSVMSFFTFTEKIFPQKIASENIGISDFAVYENNFLNSVSTQNSFSFWGIIWLCGTVISALIFIVLYLIGFRKFRFATRVDAALPEKIRLRHKVEIRVCEGISSPLTYGIFKPVILLPKSFDLINSKQTEFVLTHEFVHIKRFDFLRKIAVITAVCAHWFNPFVWVMFVLFNRDIELACDDETIKIIGRENRKDYAMTMIELLDDKTSVLYNYFCKNAVEERILSILNNNKKGVFSCVFASILSLFVTAVFATSSSVYSWKKLNEINGFEQFFDRSITGIMLALDDDNEHLIYARGEPFIECWSEFFCGLELRRTSEKIPQNIDKIIIENEEKSFEFSVIGNDFFVINGVVYECKSAVKMPFDKTLNPFGTGSDDNIIFSEI